MHGKQILNGSKVFHVLFQFFFRCGSHFVTDVIHLFFHVKQKIKGRGEHLADRHALFKDGVLVQITDTDVFRPFYPALIRHQLACNDIHKSGFPFAVGSDQANMLTLQQTEGNILENGSVTKAMG